MGEGKQGKRKACWGTQCSGKSHEIPRLPLLGIASKVDREGATLYDLRDFFAGAPRRPRGETEFSETRGEGVGE